jgi:hypothetical protein
VDLDRKVRFCLLGDLVHWGSVRYVRKGSGNVHLAPTGPVGEPQGAFFPGVFERRVNVCSGNFASLPTGALLWELEGGTLLETLEYT